MFPCSLIQSETNLNFLGLWKVGKWVGPFKFRNIQRWTEHHRTWSMCAPGGKCVKMEHWKMRSLMPAAKKPRATLLPKRPGTTKAFWLHNCKMIAVWLVWLQPTQTCIERSGLILKARLLSCLLLFHLFFSKAFWHAWFSFKFASISVYGFSAALAISSPQRLSVLQICIEERHGNGQLRTKRILELHLGTC